MNQPSSEPEPASGREQLPDPAQQGGPPHASDLVWQRAALELSPERTLARITDNARNVVNTVGIVGALLSGLGFLTTTVVENDPLLLTGAFVSSIVAAIAVALALYSLITRNDEVATGNLVEVEAWFRREISRRRSVAFASVALFISAVISLLVVGYGGYQAIREAHQSTIDNHTRVDVSSNSDGTWTIHVTGRVEDLPDGATVFVQIKNLQEPVIESSAFADGVNAVTLDIEATVVGRPDLTGTVVVSNRDGTPSTVRRLDLVPTRP